MTINKWRNDWINQQTGKVFLFFPFLPYFFISFFYLYSFIHFPPFVNHSEKTQRIFFWNWKRMIHFFFPKTWEYENFLKKMEFPFVLCGVQFASGLIPRTCLKSCDLGIPTKALYESTVLEGSFSLTTSKSFTLSDLWWLFIV